MAACLSELALVHDHLRVPEVPVPANVVEVQMEVHDHRDIGR
ncbi:MAG: hypothetical protein OXG37_00390 [Actinomycetia bacterium]|nr:hypothetical protein [Actinomycetes bacterium]